MATKIDAFRFDTAPADQGQMVDRSWACVGDGFILKRVDRSVPETTFEFYPLSKRGQTTEWEFYAINGNPIQQGLATRDGARAISESEAIAMLSQND